MKRNLVALSLLVLLVTAACAVTTPGAAGTVTGVNGNTVTVAGPNGQTMTYTLTPSTHIYNASGSKTSPLFLTNGQRVMVWSNGETAVRINVES
jgi:ABC-type Fe3+-hydroxamate transport system substrate-binding protein